MRQADLCVNVSIYCDFFDLIYCFITHVVICSCFHIQEASSNMFADTVLSWSNERCYDQKVVNVY